MVEAAIAAGKIEKDKKETWVKQAEANFDLTKEILDQIPAREDLNKHITNDPTNHKAAVEGMKTEQEKIQEKVKAVVGENFKFRTPKF
jgi:hypothetical protein